MTGRPTMTSEVRRAREMRANRATYEEIMTTLGRGAQWVRNHARDVPGARRRTTPGFPDNREEARRLKRSGMKRAEIANRIGVTMRTVSLWCEGVHADPDASMESRAVRAAEQGMTNAEIAKLVGYKSAKIVSTVLWRARRQKEKVK